MKPPHRVADRSVVYVTSRWGEPTQTFVRREATALAERGIDVRALSLKRPLPAGPVARPEHLRPPAVVAGVLAAIARHPYRAGAVFVTILRRASRRNVTRHLGAAAIGVAWGHRQRRGDEQLRLHAHFGWVAATAAWAASRMSGAAYTVVLHAFELHTRRYVDGFSSVPLRGASAVFAISEHDAALARELFGVDVGVLRMGVDRSWLVDDISPRQQLVVTVGSLVTKKGHGVLLEALARVRAPWRCVIVGEGPLRSTLEERAVTLGLSGRVCIAGALDELEVRRLLRRAAVSCLACTVAPGGDRDGIPVSLIEAMASGAAVVTTSIGGIPELVAGAGELVEPDDVDALAAALDRLADPVHRDRLARLGLARVRQGWLADQVVRPLVDLVER